MISRNFIHRAADRLTSQRLIVELCSWLAQREPGEPSWASLPGSKAINCTFLNSVIPVTNSGLAADRTKEIGSTPSDSAATWLGWRHAPYRELSYAMHGAVNACMQQARKECVWWFHTSRYGEIPFFSSATISAASSAPRASKS